MKSVMVSIPAEQKQKSIIIQLFFLLFSASEPKWKLLLPTKHCFLLSHKGAARTPLETRAKNAFFTWGWIAQQIKAILDREKYMYLI